MIKMYVEDERLKPTRANSDDAGMDLRTKMPYCICPGEMKLVGTGVYIDLNSYSQQPVFGMLVARSSLAAKKDLILLNSVGIIDAGYRGEIKAQIKNIGDYIQVLDSFERFAQLIILNFQAPSPVFVDKLEELSDSDRGNKGFGSSG